MDRNNHTLIEAKFDPDHISYDHKPERQTQGASGVDLPADIEEEKALLKGRYQLVPTGLRLSLPDNLEAQVRPRSGLALNHGVTVLNSPGTVDSDYRGDIGVILINHGKSPFHVAPGDRIAQLVIAEVTNAYFTFGYSLDETDRGSAGFGSTGQ